MDPRLRGDDGMQGCWRSPDPSCAAPRSAMELPPPATPRRDEPLARPAPRWPHCAMPAPAYPRDLVGYGRTPPHPQWPGNARIAVQFVLNFEEGGEACVLH